MDLSKLSTQFNEISSKVGKVVKEGKKKIGDVKDKAKEAVDNAKSKIEDIQSKVGTAVDDAKNKVNDAKNKAEAAVGDGSKKLEDAKSKVGDLKDNLGDAVGNSLGELTNNLPPGLPGGLPGMTGMLGTNDNSDSDDSNGPAQSYEMDEDEKKKIETRINDFEQKMKEEFTLKLNNYFKQENNKKFGEVKEETHRFIDTYFSGIIKKDEEDQIKEALINVIKNNLEDPIFKNKEEKEEEEEEPPIEIIIGDRDEVRKVELIKPIK